MKNKILIIIHSSAPSEFVNTELASDLLRGTLHAVHVSVESVEFLNVAASVVHRKRQRSGSLSHYEKLKKSVDVVDKLIDESLAARSKSERTAPKVEQSNLNEPEPAHIFIPTMREGFCVCGKPENHPSHV